MVTPQKKRGWVIRHRRYYDALDDYWWTDQGWTGTVAGAQVYDNHVYALSVCQSIKSAGAVYSLGLAESEAGR